MPTQLIPETDVESQRKATRARFLEEYLIDVIGRSPGVHQWDVYQQCGASDDADLRLEVALALRRLVEHRLIVSDYDGDWVYRHRLGRRAVCGFSAGATIIARAA